MLRSNRTDDEFASKVAFTVSDVLRDAVLSFGMTEEVLSLRGNLEKLEELLALHLRIAETRVGLEQMSLGASKTLMAALASLSKEAKLDKATEEVGRKADSLRKALEVLEMKGHLDKLCESAARGITPTTKNGQMKPSSS